MKCQMNVRTRRITAWLLCIMLVATLLPVAALAAGSCSYRFSTGVVCGKYITQRTSSTSPTYRGVHYYYDPDTGTNTARCDYSYYTVTEADVCAAGHITNQTTTRYEFDHACERPGK